MHPALRPVILADDAVLPIERRARAGDLFREIDRHRRAVLGMDQGEPPLDRALVVLVDSENLVHYLRTRPGSRIEIEDIAAQPGYSLRFAQKFFALPQLLCDPDPLSDFAGDAEQADHLSVFAPHRVLADVDPKVPSVLGLCFPYPIGNRRSLKDLLFKRVEAICIFFGKQVVIGQPEQRGARPKMSEEGIHVLTHTGQNMVSVLEEDEVVGAFQHGLEVGGQGLVLRTFPETLRILQQ